MNKLKNYSIRDIPTITTEELHNLFNISIKVHTQYSLLMVSKTVKSRSFISNITNIPEQRILELANIVDLMSLPNLGISYVRVLKEKCNVHSVGHLSIANADRVYHEIRNTLQGPISLSPTTCKRWKSLAKARGPFLEY